MLIVLARTNCRLKTFSTCNNSWIIKMHWSSVHSSNSSSSNAFSCASSNLSCGTRRKYFVNSWLRVFWMICFRLSEISPRVPTGMTMVSGRSDSDQTRGISKKKKYWEENEYMSHKVSYKWFRRTQYIPRFGRFYKKWGFYLDGVWLWRISGGYSQEMVWLTRWNSLSD